MSDFYSTVAEVVAFSGAVPETLGLSDVADLNELIERWLVQAKDFIDRDRNRNFTTEDAGVPASIDNIAMRMCANMIRSAERQRNRSVVEVEGGEQELTLDQAWMFTAAIKADLRRIPSKPSFGLQRMETEDELEQEES